MKNKYRIEKRPHIAMENTEEVVVFLDRMHNDGWELLETTNGDSVHAVSDTGETIYIFKQIEVTRVSPIPWG
jgi:hypothetical protein